MAWITLKETIDAPIWVNSEHIIFMRRLEDYTLVAVTVPNDRGSPYTVGVYETPDQIISAIDAATNPPPIGYD